MTDNKSVLRVYYNAMLCSDIHYTKKVNDICQYLDLNTKNKVN